MRKEESREVLLSICIPTYNRGALVEECVKKCLEIPLEDIEIVVSDNASSDDTQDRIEAINDDRLVYHRNSFNIGGMSNFVQVFCHAKGKWLLLISDEDDVISIDWNRVRQVLMDSNEVSIFRAPVRGYITLNATRYRSNTFAAYKFICDYFHYISGVIFNRDILAKCYMEIKKDTVAWSIYAHKVMAFYCSKYGDISCMDELEVLMTRKCESDASLSDTFYSKGGEIFYMPEARLQQNISWMDIMAALAIDDKVRTECVKYSIFSQMYCVVDYYERFVDCLDKKGNYNCGVMKYLNMSVDEWRVLFLRHYKVMMKHAKEVRLNYGGLKRINVQSEVRSLYERLKKSLITFSYQLNNSEKEILDILNGVKAVYIWGNGKRGMALQQFCKKHNINLLGICDVVDEAIGDITPFGFPIVSTDEVKQTDGMILASNQIVYDALKKMNISANIVNMQPYMEI